ncbi:MAG: amidohydrolase [Bacteroidota bacterium]|jgi:omega-amidase
MSTLNITIIQTNLFWEDKQANLRLMDEKLSSIHEPGHIIILPEMFTTGFTMHPCELAEKMDGTTTEWMKKKSKEKKAIITGSIIVEENDTEGERNYYNRLLWTLPNGQIGYYDKRHLFAYAGEHEHYRHGNKRVIFSVNGWKILPQICYDLRFPVWSRQQMIKDNNGSTPEYDMIMYVANWPEKRKHAWRSLLIARAIENQCYVVAVNRTGTDGNDIQYSGNSMLIDPLGEIIFEQENHDCVKTLSVSKLELEACREKFAFLRDADTFQLFKD